MPTVRSQDATLYYEVVGPETAPALVFAHGRGGNASCWWQQVPHFCDRYRVVVFDHRGFGRVRRRKQQRLHPLRRRSGRSSLRRPMPRPLRSPFFPTN